MTKIRWWQKKWLVTVWSGQRFAIFGPYRFKFVASLRAWITPGPTEEGRVSRIVAEDDFDPGHSIHSGTVFEKRKFD